MAKYVVSYNGKYLIEAPYWSAGTWTDKIEEATRYCESDRDFFVKFYPQFTVTEVEK